MKKQKRYPFLKQSFKWLLFQDTCCICECELTKEEEVFCSDCFRKWAEKSLLRYYEGYFFVYFYRGEIRDWLHEYKFQGVESFGKILAKLIKQPFWECYQAREIDVVIPVPIHEERLLQRGFNQTEEILKHLKIPYLTMQRKKNTQALFHHHEKEDREKIMENAFVCPFSVEDKNILIFDDIITTGTTVEEMKKAILKQGRPKSISVFAISLSERVKIEQKNIQK